MIMYMWLELDASWVDSEVKNIFLKIRWNNVEIEPKFLVCEKLFEHLWKWNWLQAMKHSGKWNNLLKLIK